MFVILTEYTDSPKVNHTDLFFDSFFSQKMYQFHYTRLKEKKKLQNLLTFSSATGLMLILLISCLALESKGSSFFFSNCL